MSCCCVLARTGTVEDALAEHAADLRTVLPSDGMAICRRDEVIAGFGHRPSGTEIADLACWLLREGAARAVCHRPFSLRAARTGLGLPGRQAGYLPPWISREEPLVLLWFRAERLEVINWAGRCRTSPPSPPEPAEPGTIPGVLTRTRVVQRLARDSTRPLAALDSGRARRRAAVPACMYSISDGSRGWRSSTDSFGQTLSDKEELIAQKDLLMGEVHHRVKNSLQLVNSMLGLQEREVADPVLAAHFAEARAPAARSLHRPPPSLAIGSRAECQL